MHSAWTGVMLLALSATAVAQEEISVPPTWVEPLPLPRSLAEPEQQAPPVGPGSRDQGDRQAARETVVVQAGPIKEEDLVGPYKQPEWTQHRRFPTTRVYVQQPTGAVEFEQWFEIRIPKNHHPNNENEIRIREELEFGLGHRFQLDLYLIQVWNGLNDKTVNSLDWRAISAELRYALADWDVIPGNPTLYFEYLVFNNDENTVEPKLLFGGQLASHWHWGLNLVYERELGLHSFRTEEFKISAGLSYSLVDTLLSAGVAIESSYEAEFDSGAAHVRWDGTGGDRTREVLIGPSLQFRPIPRAHIDIEPLFGVTGESKRAKIFIVFGWDF